MNNSISRQVAIDLLDNLIGMVDDNHGSDYDAALRMGIEALKAEEPNLQQTCNQLATDLISRQAAEEALYDWELCYTWDEHCREDYDSPYIVSPTKVIDALPSAEPETCAYWDRESNLCALHRPSAQPEDKCSECDAWNKYKNYPSAEPVIRCKDCKHNPKDEWFGCPMSHLSEAQRPETAWCWKAERRIDESD